MMKLSIFMALFSGFLAFARADDTVNKLDFAFNLCRQGVPQAAGECSIGVRDRDMTNVSFHRLATDICPSISLGNNTMAIDCYNVSNRQLRLNLASCNSVAQLPARVQCITALITQADNQRVPAASSRRAGRNNSTSRTPVERRAAESLRVNSATAVEN